MPGEVETILASGLFDRAETRRFVWDLTYTAHEYIDLLNTFSVHIAMAPAKRRYLQDEISKRILSRPGGTVRRHWMTILHVARRTSS